MTDLLNAIGRNKLEQVKAIIASEPCAIHEISDYGHSSLSLAVECDNIEIAKILTDSDVDVNKKVNIRSPVSNRIFSGFVPLMFVKSENMVDLLCQYGADVKLSSDSGSSVLFIVGRTYRTDVLDRLLSYGASFNVNEIDSLTDTVKEELEFRKNELGGAEQDSRIAVLEKMLDWLRTIGSKKK